MNVASSAGNRISTVADSGAFGLVLTSRKSWQALSCNNASTAGTIRADLFRNRIYNPLNRVSGARTSSGDQTDTTAFAAPRIVGNTAGRRSYPGRDRLPDHPRSTRTIRAGCDP